ncbi:MAG: ATP-dependent DNA helicase RecG [Candidatus Sericytochromatia bacterium]|nr:ATP-dependent DNA helicase RecG [Candidatus Sericytochromatia bacterium]
MPEAAWFQLCERAIKAEVRGQYRNLKGQQFYFADFMLQQVQQARFARTEQPLANRLANIFTLYPLAAVAERRDLIAETRQHLAQLQLPRLAEAPLRQQARAAESAQLAQQLQPLKARLKPDADWREVPVQFVRGVGPKLAERLAQVGITQVGELLHYYPRRHLDYSQCVRIRNLKAGERATVWGVLEQVSSYSPPGKATLHILKLRVSDGTGKLNISLFQRARSAWLRKQFEARFPQGAQILLSGLVKWDKFSKGLSLDQLEYEILGDDEDFQPGQMPQNLYLARIVPVYPLSEGLNAKALRKAMAAALAAYAGRIQDPLPPALRQQQQLLPLAQALQQFHFPDDQAQLQAARQRLVFDELFLTQLSLQYRRKQREREQSGLQLQTRGRLAAAFLDQLPFALTQAQQRVYHEIQSDLRRPEPMGRLVQGDVGSGKTVVAVLALLEAIEAGYQGALMAPTEILAEQHYRKIFDWLLPLGLQAELLLGSQGARRRREALARLASGEAALAVGTHALIQEGVNFARLGLVVIDEQHRFGVKQRALLREKGQNPEVLSMTATPIPRTLALTLYGDLDVSIIDELPPGRQPVETRLIKGASQRRQLWELVRQELDAGRQCYVVFPLVEESEKVDLKAATVEYERFCHEIFPQYRVGLLHGKMKTVEKDQVMRAFVAHELDMLVATTVIEVGVDVPNASVMVIEHAERFGLSQLHQLRGRVGRGADRAYCYLLADKLSDTARDRLSVFTQTHDGFVIAEQDLRLRGPGEFLGTRQSGLPDLTLANLAEDTEILERARSLSLELMSHDSELLRAEHALLRAELQRFFARQSSWLAA